VVSRIRNLLRNTSFLVWLAGGIGGVFPDIDHIPLYLGYQLTFPVLWKFNILLGLTSPNEPFGRSLHGLLLVVALILAGYSIAYLCGYSKVRILRN